MKKITVNASKTYDVLCGSGLLREIGSLASAAGLSGTALIVADDNTARLFGATVSESLEKSGFRVISYVIKHGEKSKNPTELFNILNFCAENKMTRSDVIFALGGGVVGDLAGFAAASYMRGVGFVQIPTTLLAAVDSSVGGKTAVNLKAGKNLVGAFYQPDLVVCDTDAIERLPEKIFSDGMAEVIKYGALGDAELLSLLSGEIRDKISEIISICVSIKRDIVNADEHEGGVRKLLNFGHTPAHAIEKCSKYKIPHGEAVAEGMIIMARAAEKKGICKENVSDEIIKLNEKFGLPRIRKFSSGELYLAALSDKKRAGKKTSVVLPTSRGKCEVFDVSDDELSELFETGMEE